MIPSTASPIRLSRRSLGWSFLCAWAGTKAAHCRTSSPDPKPEFDANTIPFSRYGSYLTVSKHFWDFGASPAVPQNRFYVRCLKDEATPPEVFLIDLLLDGQPADFLPELFPGRLLFKTAAATIEFCLADMDLLLIRGTGCGVRLSCVTGSYANCLQIDSNSWEVMPDAARMPVLFKRRSGIAKVTAPWVQDKHHVQVNEAVIDVLPSDAHALECSLQFYEGAPAKTESIDFDSSVRNVEAEFETWQARIPQLRLEFEPKRRLAAYVLWSETVAARGLYSKPIVWGSKNWMIRLWSWDHCFVAIGLARFHPELAWQQFIAFRDLQDPHSGALADSMSNVRRSWVCTKNPIHGWALRHLLKLMPNAITHVRLQEAYEALQLWSSFWLKNRDLAGNGLPSIIHPDESFDNTSSNTIDGPVNAPEIATYLAIQMDVLSEIAGLLRYAKDQKLWRTRSDDLVAALLRELWNAKKQRFVAKRVGDGYVGPGDSILSFMPLLLGARLPAATTKALVAGLLVPGRFRTPFGVSTEALTSTYYDPESYVRGPVWAPPTFFIAEGLEKAGYRSEADKIRTEFCNACLVGGMSEHFDAKTGQPAGDPTYNWTAATFLHFASHS